MILGDGEIAHLLDDLVDALQVLRLSANDLERAKAAEEYAKARALLAHEFAGKNAESRAWEAALVVGNDEGVDKSSSSRRIAEHDYMKAQAEVELARSAIKLWIAAAGEKAE